MRIRRLLRGRGESQAVRVTSTAPIPVVEETGVASTSKEPEGPRSRRALTALWRGTLRVAPGLALCAVAVAIALVVVLARLIELLA